MKEGRSEVEFPYVFIPTLTISHCYNLLIYLALVYVWLATSGLLPMKSIVCPYKWWHRPVEWTNRQQYCKFGQYTPRNDQTSSSKLQPSSELTNGAWADWKTERAVYTGRASKKGTPRKIWYLWNCSRYIYQIYRVYRWGFNPHILQILFWFKRGNSLNFKVHFFQVNTQSRPEYSVVMNQTLHNFFVNTSYVSVINVSCLLGS